MADKQMKKIREITTSRGTYSVVRHGKEYLTINNKLFDKDGNLTKPINGEEMHGEHWMKTSIGITKMSDRVQDLMEDKDISLREAIQEARSEMMSESGSKDDADGFFEYISEATQDYLRNKQEKESK